MEVNLYDFDKTIYDGDSSLDFFKYAIKCNKKLLLYVPKILANYFLFVIRIRNKREVKECFFSFLKKIDDVELFVERFWLVHKKKIKKFYLVKSHDKDVVISASPEFLLEPICKNLKVMDLIGSEVNKKNGKFFSENCKGLEKLKRFKEKYPDAIVNEVYTDSLSDRPIIEIGKKAFLVKKNNIECLK